MGIPVAAFVATGPDAPAQGTRRLQLRTPYRNEGLCFALGDDPVYVTNQLGHTEPGFSMKVYASAVRRRSRLTGVALREFDAALEWVALGSGEPDSVNPEPDADGGQSPETAQQRLFRNLPR